MKLKQFTEKRSRLNLIWLVPLFTVSHQSPGLQLLGPGGRGQPLSVQDMEACYQVKPPWCQQLTRCVIGSC